MVPELLEKYIWLINTFLRMGEKGLSRTCGKGATVQHTREVLSTITEMQ